MDIEKIKRALLAYQSWEANLVLNREAWDNDKREYPQLTEELWDELLDCQKLRNEALDALDCSHKFAFLRSAKYTDNSGSYNTKYVRIDTFFCERCLVYKKIKKEDYSRDTPDWYKD
jgi:hypothetical protein